MASTSNNQTIQDNTVGAVIPGGNTTITKYQYRVADFIVPPCIESFHGREDKIKELDTLFFEEKRNRIVIHGLPGFGKTELSKQFAKYCKREGKVQHTFWIEAENEAKLQQSCQKLHNTYKNDRCLYIFDNALSKSSIFEYEPKSEKHLTLITSVDGNWDGVVSVQLDSLPLTEAVQFLKTILGCGDEVQNESFEELANAVSCVPLGLKIVGGFVREEKKCVRHSFSLEYYVKKIKESQFDVLHKNIAASAGNTYQKTVYNAMIVSVNKIIEIDDNRAKLALNILYACTFTDPDYTSFDALLQIPTVRELVQFNSSDSDDCRNSISDSNSNSNSDSNSDSNSNSDSDTSSSINMSFEFEDLTDDSHILFKHALGMLINLSFVTYFDNCEHIQFHRLTQSFLKDYLESRNLIEKTFTVCLRAGLIPWTIHYFIYSSTVLSFCEEYSDIVHTFFKTQNSKIKQLRILEYLAENGCVDCLKKIFKCLTENLIEFTFSCISIASIYNQFKILEYLLEYININSTYDSYEEYLFGYRLEYISIDSTNEAGDTVLHIVANTGNIESVKFLIGCGANVNAKNNAGDTPLFVLAKCLKFSKDVEWDSILKIFEFNKDLTNNNNETLLHAAAAGAKSTLIEELILNHGMDTNQTDLTNRTPIDSLFSKPTHSFDYDRLYLTFKVLNKHGPKLNIKLAHETCTFDILSSVIQNDDLELWECALQQGCDVRCKSISNDTLLHSAAKCGNLTIIKLLINKAAFYFVRYVGSNDIRNMSLIEETLDLLNCQEQTQITDICGDSMLHIAAEEAHKDLVQLLIERYKFNVNQQNKKHGITPLHSLIIWPCIESNKKNVKQIVEIMIQAGADLNIVEDEETPLQMVHRFVEYGRDVEFLIPILKRRKT